jgi:F0F1-type ATP synthase assembly protein I
VAQEGPKQDPLNKGAKEPNALSGVGGNVLAANVVVGVGLGWVAQHFFPAITPWGYGGGVILGTVSGFWQILKAEGAFKKYRPKDPKDRHV